jgi:CDP-diacylglycerol--glycerol-3-phosphate 3-phosphatidyltransferase
MVPVFLFLLCVPPGIPDATLRIITAVIFILTSLTDMIDGKIARKYNLITDFGKFMDPLADKFLVIAAMLGLLVRLDGTLKIVFVWAAAIVIFREFAVTSLRMVASSASGLVIAAAWLGKVKTVTQMLCITVVLLEPVIFPLPLFRDQHVLSYVTIAIMSVMTLWSGLDYLKTYAPYISSKK